MECYNGSAKEYESCIENLNESNEELKAKYNALSKTYDFLRNGKPFYHINNEEIKELKYSIEQLKGENEVLKAENDILKQESIDNEINFNNNKGTENEEELKKKVNELLEKN